MSAPIVGGLRNGSIVDPGAEPPITSGCHAAVTGGQLKPPFELPGQSVFVTASIGIATGAALRDRSEALLQDADAAMYEAEARGRPVTLRRRQRSACE
jgi:predicted signal transduction protein with EAL and GGDEF domain